MLALQRIAWLLRGRGWKRSRRPSPPPHLPGSGSPTSPYLLPRPLGSPGKWLPYQSLPSPHWVNPTGHVCWARTAAVRVAIVATSGAVAFRTCGGKTSPFI